MTHLRAVYRNIRSRRRPAGAVLLLVLCAVAILTVLAVEIAHRARLDVQRGQRIARDLAVNRAFDSGIAAARGLLFENRKNPAFDYFGDGWSKPLTADLGDGLTINVQASDESGKLNLLKLKGDPNGTDNSDRTVSRLFAYLRKHDSMRADQWKDAEARVRQRLGILTPTNAPDGKAPTPAPVAPLLTLDGLREAGVPTELIFGSAQAAGEKPELALCDVVTTFGDGLINLNTAQDAVLYTMGVEYDDTVVNSISAWRGQRSDDGTGNFKAFQTPKDLEQVAGIVHKANGNDLTSPDVNLYTKVQEHFTVRSSCFSAKIEVLYGTRRRIGWAFFEVSKPLAGSSPVDDITMLAFEEIEP